jgi:hypothetical protein
MLCQKCIILHNRKFIFKLVETTNLEPNFSVEKSIAIWGAVRRHEESANSHGAFSGFGGQS